ncbi:MAG TPA: M23 family metallopeptidase, partial [Bacteroidales bacterium]|nr:M23 family metallopeptidase [Bacteroidales bacterium]
RNIRVNQGEVIGFSGASGIGPPHLHFELRTPSEKPYNPLLTNLHVRDTIPPQIKGISVEPLSAASTIEGKNAIYTKRAWRKNDHYELGTVRASGKIGLGVNVFDQSNKVHNAYAVYELQLTIDGQDLFKSRIDSFSYDETHQMFIDRVYPILKNSKQGYQRLFIADGNSLPFYQRDGKDGKLNLATGTHQVRIRATDYFGNSTTTHLTLNITDPQITHTLPPESVDKENGERGNAEAPHWFHNWITFEDSQIKHITVATTDSTNFYKHKNGYALNLESSDNQYIKIPSTGPMQLHRIIPGNRGYLSSADGQGFAVFPEHTFYDTLSVGMSIQKSRNDSMRVHILPETFPINEQFSFYISRDSSLTDIQKLAWYKLDREDHEWELIPTNFTKEYLIGHPETLGTFSILRDTVAPELRRPRLRRRPDGQWLVMVDVKDNLSGLDYPRTKIWVNNKRGIAEFEPEDDRIVYYHPGFNPSSSSSLTVTVEAFDYMGNKKSRTFYLNLNKRNGTAKK